MSYLRLEKDANGIVELIFDQQGKSVNVMGDEYAEAMPKALDELEAQKGDIKGVYIRSGKPGQFFAGGDITQMLEMDLNPGDEERQQMFESLLESKAPLRRLEALGVPVAVGINGAALGGGFEIALACHHRVALDDGSVQVGLPEAMLGLMPDAWRGWRGKNGAAAGNAGGTDADLNRQTPEGRAGAGKRPVARVGLQ